MFATSPPSAPARWEDLPGFEADASSEAFRVFVRHAEAMTRAAAPLRAGRPPSEALLAAARAALAAGPLDDAGARAFFRRHFRPWRVEPGFLTGYYEPCVQGSLAPSEAFAAPILARPADLVSFAPGEGPPGFDPALAGARRRGDGALVPYPDRAAIEEMGGEAIVWLRDAVEVFLIQVQGSARVQLPDGQVVRLVYDGRNGQPYTSIGRLLIEAGEIAEADMSLAALKGWLRAHGLAPGERGRELMRRNRSYIFFRLAPVVDPAEGPLGGAGLPLVPLRSAAVDRTLWSYGTPLWIDAELPWRGDAASPFRRLMIAGDTGSAIVGPGRVDLFFGAGDEAGRRAGSIRHEAAVVVALPHGDEP